MSTAIPVVRNSRKNFTKYEAVKNDTYEARFVRFVGLGVHPQPDYEGKTKAPAFKASIVLELIDVDATGREYRDEDDKVGKEIEPRPSCQFLDVFLFPGATRGRVFDLCKVLDPSIDKVPSNLEWFENHLGNALQVRVSSYVNKKGETKNKVADLSEVPSKYKDGIGKERTEKIFFNPYSDSVVNLQAYGKIYPFQRKILEEAIDSNKIPFAGKEPPRQEQQEETVVKTSNESPVDFDDDIPF